MEPKSTDSTQVMTTLSECINKAQSDGYKDDFRVKPSGLVSGDGRYVYGPEDVAISNFYRFEGYSDPGDNMILYLIETSDGRRGTLLDAYDAYADPGVSNFISQIKSIKKKPHEKKGIAGFFARLFKRNSRG